MSKCEKFMHILRSTRSLFLTLSRKLICLNFEVCIVSKGRKAHYPSLKRRSLQLRRGYPIYSITDLPAWGIQSSAYTYVCNPFTLSRIANEDVNRTDAIMKSVGGSDGHRISTRCSDNVSGMYLFFVIASRKHCIL